MTRRLYAWESDGKFYLSAFSAPRTHDGKRPAGEYDTKDALEAEVNRRGADVVWESLSDE